MSITIEYKIKVCWFCDAFVVNILIIVADRQLERNVSWRGWQESIKLQLHNNKSHSRTELQWRPFPFSNQTVQKKNQNWNEKWKIV